MPEQFFAYIRTHIKKEWNVCFFAALCMGFFIHFYKLTNWLPNWDGIVFRYHDMNMTHFGRCFLSFACGLSSWYDLPWLNGVLTIVYVGLAAVCICALFEFKKPVVLILTAGIMVAFPTVTSTLAYSYTADGYAMALFCSCLAVVLMNRGRGSRVAAVLLMAFSLGIYQAYITVTVTLCLLYLTDRLLFFKWNAKQAFLQGSRFLVCGVAGFGLYLLALRLILYMSGTGLSEYQNVNTALSFSEMSLLCSAKRCIGRFVDFFFDFSGGFSLFFLLNGAILLLLAVLITSSILRMRIWKERYSFVLLLVCMGLMPFAATAVYFGNANLDYHNLMLSAYGLVYIFLLLFYERCLGERKWHTCAGQWMILLLTALTVYNFSVIANVSYHKMQMAYEKSYGAALQIADRIRQTKGSEDCEKIAFLGGLPGSEAYSSELPPDMTGITDGYIFLESDPIIGQDVYHSFLTDYCGLDYEAADGEEKERLMEMPEVQSMGYWPEENSVRVIDDTVVVWLGESRFNRQ